MDLDLCKTLLTSGILGYPSPTILNHDGTSNDRNVTCFPKISRVLYYLNTLEFEADKDLVLIVDGDDVEFQLPVEILLSRYYDITKAATVGLHAGFDKAPVDAGIRQSVIFGADKRCTSAASRDGSCQPVPPPPSASDLYSNYTDVAMAYNDWFHYRQKYVNPGYILGPIAAVRKLFERAEEVSREGENDTMHASTSEQAIFARIYSEQERWRDDKRSGHTASSARWFSMSRTRTQAIEKSSDSSHEMTELDSDTDYEFGICVDYLSELGHSTMNSNIGRDSQWITWSDPDSTTFFEQVNDKHQRDGRLDCAVNVPDSLPDDILYASPPFHLLTFRDFAIGSTYDAAADESYNGPGWNNIPLYTQLCFGTVPVLIHHNGDKQEKNSSWAKLWLRERSNAMLQMQQERLGTDDRTVEIDDWAEFKKMPGIKGAGGAWSNNGKWTEWWDICPHEKYGPALFYEEY